MATESDQGRGKINSADSRPTRRRARHTPAAGPVWTRPATRKPERLTLEAILTTAIGLADAEGLDAVSIRRVATELKARPMSLYSFFSRKDDLVDLMLDRIMGEMLLDTVPGDWQEALRAIARRTRQVGERHPWLMFALSQRPSIGPNAARHAEQSLAAVASLDLDSARVRSLLVAVDIYTVGAGTIALAERQMQQRDQLTESQWRATTEAYFQRLTETDDLPHLAKLGSPVLLRRGDEDDAFEDGLNWLLAGFAATLDSDGRSRKRRNLRKPGSGEL